MNIRDLWPWLKAEFNWRIMGKRYEIRTTKEFDEQLAELPEHVQEEIKKTMERIGRNPYSGEKTYEDEEYST